jgi:hypothetical protein
MLFCTQANKPDAAKPPLVSMPAASPVTVTDADAVPTAVATGGPADAVTGTSTVTSPTKDSGQAGQESQSNTSTDASSGTSDASAGWDAFAEAGIEC